MSKFSYQITFMNITDDPAIIYYGNVHDWWDPSNPHIVVGGGRGIISATGYEYVSGGFWIVIRGHIYKIEFNYSPGQAKPDFRASPPVTIVSGPTAANNVAYVTFEIGDHAGPK